MFDSEASGPRQSKRQIKVTEIFKESYQELKSGTKKVGQKRIEPISLKRVCQTKSRDVGQVFEFVGPWIDCLYPHDNGMIVPVKIQVCITKQNEMDEQVQYYGRQINEIRRRSTNSFAHRKKVNKGNVKQGDDVQDPQIFSIIQNLLNQVLNTNKQESAQKQPRQQQVIQKYSQKRRPQFESYHDIQSLSLQKKRIGEEGISRVDTNEQGFMLNHVFYGGIQINRQKEEQPHNTVYLDRDLKDRFDQIKQTFRPLILL